MLKTLVLSNKKRMCYQSAASLKNEEYLFFTFVLDAAETEEINIVTSTLQLLRKGPPITK
jgi:hypothetical protein